MSSVPLAASGSNVEEPPTPGSSRGTLTRDDITSHGPAMEPRRIRGRAAGYRSPACPYHSADNVHGLHPRSPTHSRPPSGCEGDPHSHSAAKRHSHTAASRYTG